jgi:hypothetical protein
MSSATPPPSGWYQDPANSNLERFWNGSAWTNDVRDPRSIVFNPSQPPSDLGYDTTVPTFNNSVSRPTVGGTANFNNVTPPNNYLVFGILTTIFCCLPLGIVSIIFSSKVNSLWAQGDFERAYIASSKAKKFALFALFAGIIIAVLGFVVAIYSSTATNISNRAGDALVEMEAQTLARAANSIAALDESDTITTSSDLGVAHFELFCPSLMFPDREYAFLNEYTCLEVFNDDLSSIFSVYIDNGLALVSESSCF